MEKEIEEEVERMRKRKGLYLIIKQSSRKKWGGPLEISLCWMWPSSSKEPQTPESLGIF